MKDVKEFLENKYSEYVASATSKQYIDRKYTASNCNLSDDELCECIEDATDWEVCEIYGLLEEVCERARLINEWEAAYSENFESVVDKAIEILRKA